jgi:hypothetical protein
VEIWDESLWKDYRRKIEQGAEGMAQTLGDLGML